MKAVVLMGNGGPEMLEYLDVPTPAPGPGEVLVRLQASAVNNTDIAFRQNWYDKDVRVPWPRIQGAGGVGTIDGVGDGVDPQRIGRRVIVDPFLRRPAAPVEKSLVTLMGSTDVDGCFAEFVVVSVENTVAISSDVPVAEAACLPTAYQTAEEMQLRAGISAGQTVLVTGASGGVGCANVELAAMRGARVFAVASREKHDLVRAAGADVVLQRDGTGSAELLPAFDAVLDVTGGPMVQTWLESIVLGGVYVTAGAIAGWETKIDMRTVIYNDLRLIGQQVARPNALVNLASYAEAGLLHPQVAAVFPLATMKEAQAMFVEKEFVGKIVIDIDGSAGAR
jgi:NADPH:quinone reductase-like Zn-dependent oxidoreductase